jgi:hypothetical protein
MAPGLAVWERIPLPQCLRNSTLAEVAWGQDMMVLDWRGVPPQRSSAQESPGFSHGEWPRGACQMLSSHQQMQRMSSTLQSFTKLRGGNVDKGAGAFG